MVGEPGSTRRGVARSGAWNAAVFAVSALVTFFVAPIFVSRLGDSAYGVWSLIIAFTGYCGLADLGVRPAIVHFISRRDALGEHEDVNRFVNTAFVTFSAGAVLTLIASGIVALYLPAWFHIPANLAEEATAAVLIMGATVAITLPPNAFTAVLVGKGRFDLLCRIDLVTIVARTAAVTGILLNRGGLVALALANLAADVGQIAWKTRTAFRVQPTLRFAPRLADRAHAKRLLGYGVLAIGVAFAGRLVWQTDAIVIGTMLSTAAIAYFTVGAGLPGQVRSLCDSVARVLVPTVGALDARGDRDAIARMLETSSRSLLALAGPILVYLAVIGPAFLAQWMGERFRETSGQVLLVLALAAAAPVASLPFVAVLFGTNRMRLLLVLTFAEGLSNLALSLALAPTFGIVGVAVGTAIPSVVIHAFVLPVIVCRRYGPPWRTIAGRIWGAPLASAAITALILRLLIPVDENLGWLALVLCAFLATAVFYGSYALATVVASWVRRSDVEPPAMGSAS